MYDCTRIAGTLLITIYLNFPSIVRHTVPCWLSSRHFNIHGLSGGKVGLRQARRVFSGHIDVRLQRRNANQNVEERGKKRNALLFNSRNIVSGENERTGRSIRTDNRSLIPFDFYYRDSLSIPRGNHEPPSSDPVPQRVSSVFRPDD